MLKKARNPMKELRRITIVNWYRIEAIDLDIQGSTAIIGPNAAGKSSVLDAIQTVIFGCNKNHVKLYAGKSSKNKRDVREYCLGVMYDLKENGETTNTIEPRKSAITYLGLSYCDTVTNEWVSCGISLTATLADPEEQVKARFIIAGDRLSVGDFIDTDANGRRPRVWDVTQAYLEAKFGARFTKEPQAENFIRKMNSHLSRDFHRPNDEKAIIKNLKNSIAFGAIEDTTDFVRRFLLDDSTIDVGQYRTSLANYEYLHEQTSTARKKLGALNVIKLKCDDVAQSIKKQVACNWVEQEARIEEVNARIEPLQNNIDDRTEQNTELTGTLNESNATLEKIRQRHLKKVSELAKSNTKAQIELLQAEMAMLTTKLRSAEIDLKNIRSIVLGISKMPEHSNFLPPGLLDIIRRSQKSIESDDGLLAELWPKDVAATDALFADYRTHLPAFEKIIEDTAGLLVVEVCTLEHELIEIEGKISDLKSGSSLQKATKDLRELLLKCGIESSPICDIIDVTDEKWRPAVEAFMGGLREALLVDPKHAKDAITIFRRESKTLKGARVIDTTKTDRWLNKREHNSMATLISSDNPHATAYVNRILGDIIMVDHEHDLNKHDRSVTCDLMLYQTNSYTRMHDKAAMLGEAARKRSLEEYIKQHAIKNERFAVAGKKLAACKSIGKTLNYYNMVLAKSDTSVAFIVTEKNQHTLDIQEKEQKIERLKADTEYKKLERDLNDLAAQVKREAKDVEVLESNISDNKISIGTSVQQIKNFREIEQTHLEVRSSIEKITEYDRTTAVNTLNNYYDKLGQHYQAIAEEAKGQAATFGRSVTAGRTFIKEKIEAFYFDFSKVAIEPSLRTELFDEFGIRFEPVYRHVADLIADLEENQLAEFEERAENAKKVLENVFRSELVSKLNEKFATVNETLQRINHRLKKIKLTNEIYEFKSKPAAGMEDFKNFIEKSDAQSQSLIGTLFDEAADESSETRAVIAEFNKNIRDKDGQKRLEDYRNYFTFDVIMKDEHGRQMGNLKNRIDKGSGGENQAPFYIAIAAALATAYRISPRHADGTHESGIALALFDEAFSVLDTKNSINCARFFKDSGLQMVFCAPDDVEWLALAMCETIVYIHRDGGAVEFDVVYTTDAGRKLAMTDNPLFEDAVDTSVEVAIEAAG
jgi:energy-coupling factor transporter ATP-binding protein EcfA2